MSEQDRRMALIAMISSKYYKEGKNQQDIAEEFGIARTMISRFLNEAREKGIVSFNVKYPWTSEEIECKLVEKFGLKAARVVVHTEDNREDMLALIGIIAAKYLESLLTENSIIGISWGSALFRMIEGLETTNMNNIEVVQLIGATGSENNLYDGPLLAQLLAKRLNCRYVQLHAPLVVKNPAVRAALIQDPNIEKVLRKARQANIALVGIGALNTDYSLLKTGYMTNAEMETLIKAGGCGDICARQFTAQGVELNSEFSRRTIGIELKDLMSIDSVIAVAGGLSKARSILGALRGKKMNILITDHTAAMEILRLDELDRK